MHKQFLNDNSGTQIFDNKLVLRGVIIPDFYAKGKSVWERGRQMHEAWELWQLECDVYPTDLVVYMFDFIQHEGFRHSGPKEYDGGGLWLLRPAENNEFMLIACLSWYPDEFRILYGHWKWNPVHAQKFSSLQPPIHEFRRFSIEPCHTRDSERSNFFEREILSNTNFRSRYTCLEMGSWEISEFDNLVDTSQIRQFTII